ncbi:MAG: GntR family transcriptional regulator, partial [Bacteroidota bacterium]
LAGFEELILFYRENADFPKGIKKGFEQFLAESGQQGRILSRYTEGSLQKGKVYITISDTSLFKILKESMQHSLELGRDIGLIAHNDSPVKEIIAGGITTISTDFKQMALDAAQCVLNRNVCQLVIPSRLIRRASL